MRRRDFLVETGRAAVGLAASTRLLGFQETGWKALTLELEKEIPQWLEAANVPGLSIAVISGAQTVWRRGFGAKDVSSRSRVDTTTMFEAASMSKPVFAYVVLKLCQKGVLDLDIPLTNYTTERFLEGDPRLDLITARHVLSHTTGFQNWRSDAEPLAIHFTPGSKYSYSGEGYNYLQTVVTHLLRQRFEEYMTTNLFVPFDMTSSGYAWNNRFATSMARPHDPKGVPLENKKSDAADVARYGSAGALLTTPTDYARLLIEVMNPKAPDAARLGPEGTHAMLLPQVSLNDALSSSWALGWRIIPSKGREFFLHGGDNQGFHCVALGSTAGRSGYVAMTNGENGQQVLSKLNSHPAMQAFLLAPVAP